MAGGDGAAQQTLGRARLLTWAHLVASRLEAARAELDALNVFPVADGDTGTNLSLTVSRALGECEGSGPEDVARALLVQARGSSGVIASQLVRGWTEVLLATGPDGLRPLDAPGGLDARTVAAALARGDALAWQAVAAPVEGTVLTVSRAVAAAAAEAAGTGAGTAAVVEAAVAAGEQALRRTPAQLPVLAAAGVVDSGGSALVLALAALRDVLHGDAAATTTAGPLLSAPATAHGVAGLDLDPDGPAYEVMYLLAAEEGAGDRLRDALAALGDSVVVVGGGGLWHAHVHTDDPGGAVEQGVALGRPHDIRITHFAAAAAAVVAGPRPAATPLAVLVSVDGDATAEVCREAGAVVVTASGLASAAAAGGDRLVLVVPGSTAAAEQAHALPSTTSDGGAVVVVPSSSPVQALAALRALATDDGAPPGTAVEAACEAARACRHLAVDGDPAAAVGAVAGAAAAGADLVTLVPGVGGEATAAAVAEELRARHPLLTVDVVGGGHPSPLLWVGVE